MKRGLDLMCGLVCSWDKEEGGVIDSILSFDSVVTDVSRVKIGDKR